MIITAIAHDEGPDLGKAYNEVMERVHDDDWVCFIDHDAMFTTRTWFAQLHEAIKLHPNAGLFGVMTNRGGNAQQQIQGVDVDNHNIAYHRRIGKKCAESFEKDEDAYLNVNGFGSDLLPGVVMLTSKKAWLQVKGFPEGFFLGVDNAYHTRQKAAGNAVFLMRRVYVYHWYRANGDHEHIMRLERDYSYRP